MAVKHKFEWYGKKIDKKIEKVLILRVTQAAQLCATASKKLIKEPKSGRVYKIRGKGKKKSYKTHTASAPGEAPAILTGTLWRSITSTKAKRIGSRIVAEFGTNIKYGRWLELGTRNIKKRPFLRPAIKKMNERIKRLIGRKIV